MCISHTFGRTENAQTPFSSDTYTLQRRSVQTCAMTPETGAPVCICAADAASLTDATLNCNLLFFGKDETYPPADRLLREGDTVSFGDETLTVIETPGHTAGGMCYYCTELQSVISGDTLFCESVGRTDFPTGSGSELERSVREKLFVLPEDTKVFPGHMNMTTIGWEKENNPYF